MNNHSRAIALILLILSCTVLPGCMTANAHKEISKKQVFVDDYPKAVYGSYLGQVIYEGEQYHHVFFDTFPWPSYQKTPTMHIYIPMAASKEVHIFNAARDLTKNPPQRKTTFYPNNSVIYLEPDVKPEKRYVAALLIVTEGTVDDAKSLFKDRLGKSYHHATIMMLDKHGPGTRLITGRSVGTTTTIDGRTTRTNKMAWGETPYVVNYKPYRRKWYSVADNLVYLVTVPLDILTSPLQAIYLGVGNWMMSGMSPK